MQTKEINGNRKDAPVVKPRTKSDPALDKFLGTKNGIVKRFGDYSKPGYGHIYDSDNNEYFVHYRDIVGTGFRNLARGQHVVFKAYEGPTGLYATEVKVVNV